MTGGGAAVGASTTFARNLARAQRYIAEHGLGSFSRGHGVQELPKSVRVSAESSGASLSLKPGAEGLAEAARDMWGASDVKVLFAPNNVHFRAMVVCTATSGRHARAVANGLASAIRSEDRDVSVSCRRDRHPDWAVVDAGDVVVHVCTEEERLRIGLEELWAESDAMR